MKKSEKNYSYIQETFFNFLSEFQFEEKELDYSVIPHHIKTLQSIAEVSNSGVHVFDLNKKQSVFYSSNFGKLLGYKPSDYEKLNHHFFESKMHPDESIELAFNGVSTLKLFNSFSSEEKMEHKVINEYRMLNAEGKYVRLIEQYQVLELDKAGQLWLLMSMVDVSPNQDSESGLKYQLLNFKTGALIPLEIVGKGKSDLTLREVEILQLVKQGYLSKEISNKLSISVHTVNTHRQKVLEKLGANNSIEAITYASRFGLLK